MHMETTDPAISDFCILDFKVYQMEEVDKLGYKDHES